MLKTTWKPFWRWFPPLALLPVVGLSWVYSWWAEDYQTHLENAECLVVRAQAAIVNRKLDRLISDVRFLAAQNELRAFLDSQDPALLPKIAREYLAFSRYTRVYDQIRLLNQQGQEIVRVNFNSGDPRVVPEAQLQDKAARYYFTAIAALPAGSIYVSPLDLNIEKGVIEMPDKPMIRVGTPVFDAAGQPRGVVLVNFLAQRLLDAIADIGQAATGTAMLLNGDGYWLLSPDPALNWGFMYPERQQVRIGDRYPAVWEAMQQSPTGSLMTPQGLFTYRSLIPLSQDCDDQSPQAAPCQIDITDRWILVSQVPASTFNKAQAEMIRWLVLIGAIILLLLAVGVRALGVNLVEVQRRRQAEVGYQALLARLKQSNLELEQFAHIASHDLQEPLRTITSFLQLLERRYTSQLDQDGHDFIGFAVDGAERMRTLIDDLLTLSRLETRGKTFEGVDMGRIAEAARQDLGESLSDNQAEFVIGPLPRIMADPSQMHQLLINLVNNALRYRREEAPRIELNAVHQRDGWRFALQDNGIGIEARFLKQIFQPFKRLHSREVYPGTGIGLTVCQRIVTRHGGDIWVESEVGVGSTVFFTLPGGLPSIGSSAKGKHSPFKPRHRRLNTPVQSDKSQV